ncbi:WcaI family glycosyltransferase [Bradyrhizobium guangdongense]|uniref:WcaI family glycosyltransferase n=1 Tax=Bradyrhizobium guangdongense TaxID=1325090 RepID=UPI00131A09DE|nr:WcaI family glycosyltransferase [Bradyrhizobium guangdongense]
MRILLIGINYAPDLIGVAKYNTELCESLVAEGHEVRVVTAPPYYPAWSIPAGLNTSYFRRSMMEGVSVVRAPIYVPRQPTGAKRLIHHLSFALTSLVPALIDAYCWRPDIIISVAPSLMSARFASFVARRIDAKSWLHVQDFEIDAAYGLGLLRNASLRKVMLKAEAAVLRSFDRVSSICPQMVERLWDKDVDPQRTTEIRNWIDTDAIFPRPKQTRYRTSLNIDEDDVVALYSGTMSAKQGLDLLVEAAALLRRNPRLHFILAGEGPHKARLVEMASENPRVHFLGLQPNESFNELLATADLHVVPQRAEAADLVLPSKLGAMFASARPVVAMAERGTGLAAEVQGAGLLVPAGDVRSLADAILQLSEDPSLRERLGAEGRKRSIERWDRRTIVRRWIASMGSICGRPGRSEHGPGVVSGKAAASIDDALPLS